VKAGRASLVGGGGAAGAETVCHLGVLLADAVSRAGGTIGTAFRRSLPGVLHRLAPRPQHESSEQVFPVPFILSQASAESRVVVVQMANLIISVLNFLHAGAAQADGFAVRPSAAQARVQTRIRDSCSAFFRSGVQAPTREAIDEDLGETYGYGGSQSHATLPLGERCRIPTVAAQVDLAGLLDRRFPHLAQQVREPRALLLPASRRPQQLPRPFIRVGPGYGSLVAAACRSGLQVPGVQRRVWKHRGKTLINGAFAVKKDPDEDWFISALRPY